MRRAPVHAGGLSPWERLAFALVFSLMAAFVVVVTVSAARSHGHAPGRGRAAPRVLPAVRAAPRRPGRGGTARPARPPAIAPAASDRRLAAALAPVLRSHRGTIAVGVVDRASGAAALYQGGLRFPAAGLARVDILAALLLRQAQRPAPLSPAQRHLAAQMIQTGDNAAASALWRAAGGAGGMAAANARLRLWHTSPGRAGYWGLTSTTVTDQLRLLADLASRRSPLAAARRSYALGLMRHVESGQAWGVAEAATPGSRSAVTSGWLPHPRRWVIGSIGVIHHGGHVLLIAVLCSRQPTEAGGVILAEAAAVAAAASITARS